jgi:predicted Zn-ribbon and HTH transcriptional regulator
MPEKTFGVAGGPEMRAPPECANCGSKCSRDEKESGLCPDCQ